MEARGGNILQNVGLSALATIQSSSPPSTILENAIGSHFSHVQSIVRCKKNRKRE